MRTEAEEQLRVALQVRPSFFHPLPGSPAQPTFARIQYAPCNHRYRTAIPRPAPPQARQRAERERDLYQMLLTQLRRLPRRLLGAGAAAATADLETEGEEDEEEEEEEDEEEVDEDDEVCLLVASAMLSAVC